MGWLSWTPEVVLASDVNLIVLALKSKSELLETIHGGGKKPEGKRKGKPGAKEIKEFLGRHKRGKGGKK